MFSTNISPHGLFPLALASSDGLKNRGKKSCTAYSMLRIATHLPPHKQPKKLICVGPGGRGRFYNQKKRHFQIASLVLICSSAGVSAVLSCKVSQHGHFLHSVRIQVTHSSKGLFYAMYSNSSDGGGGKGTLYFSASTSLFCVGQQRHNLKLALTCRPKINILKSARSSCQPLRALSVCTALCVQEVCVGCQMETLVIIQGQLGNFVSQGEKGMDGTNDSLKEANFFIEPQDSLS